MSNEFWIAFRIAVFGGALAGLILHLAVFCRNSRNRRIQADAHFEELRLRQRYGSTDDHKWLTKAKDDLLIELSDLTNRIQRIDRKLARMDQERGRPSDVYELMRKAEAINRAQAKRSSK